MIEGGHSEYSRKIYKGKKKNRGLRGGRCPLSTPGFAPAHTYLHRKRKCTHTLTNTNTNTQKKKKKTHKMKSNFIIKI
jgi:hypothetical protein